MKLSTVCYHEIDLNGKAYERSLLRRLKYTSLAYIRPSYSLKSCSLTEYSKLLVWMAWGRRAEAIAILGKEVIQPRGLIGQAIDTVDNSGAELRKVFQVLANANSYPVYFHCTQGKDRTGLVALLLLLMLGVPLDVIDLDYRASQGNLISEREVRVDELRAMGLSDDFVACPTGWVRDVHNHLTSTYGSLDGYFNHLGLDEGMQRGIRSNAVNAPSAASEQ
ncbi:MAG: hypothetical protein Q9183_001771 [Haloplaca sp. 2 TL-2023]